MPSKGIDKNKKYIIFAPTTTKKQPILKHKNNIYYDNNRVQHQPDRSSKKS